MAMMGDNMIDLQDKLTAEREGRQSENLAWSLKHGDLVTEKEGVEAQMHRTIAQRLSHLQSLERQEAAESKDWSEERAGLERMAEEYPMQRSQRQVSLEHLQRDIVALETSTSAVSTEMVGLEHLVVELKRQSRETDDALAAAVSGNEHLRDQMEEQNRLFQAKNETDLADCRAAYEHKLAEARVASEADSCMTKKQLETMELDVRTQDDTLEKLYSQRESTQAEAASLDHDRTALQTQHDNAVAGLAASEQQLMAERHRCQREKLKLQSACDNDSALVNEWDGDCQQTVLDTQELRRGALSMETEEATRLKAAEAHLKDQQELMSDCQARLYQVLEQQRRIIAEDEQNQERWIDMQVVLERGLENQIHLRNEESRRFHELFSTEKRSSEQILNDFQQERDSSADSLKRLHDESRSKLAGAERERSRIEELCRMDMSQANQTIAQLQRRAEVLERDVIRVRALLAESESNLAWVRQEHGHEEREASLAGRKLEDEVRTLAGTLELSRRDDVSLTQQMETQRKRTDDERKQLQRTLSRSPGRARNPPLTVR
jgi:hypothetical protein